VRGIGKPNAESKQLRDEYGRSRERVRNQETKRLSRIKSRSDGRLGSTQGTAIGLFRINGPAASKKEEEGGRR